MCWLIQKCHKQVLCCHAYISSKGNINLFPFPIAQFMSLVRTDLPLTKLYCQGTLALSVAEILTLLRSYFYQDSHFYRVHTSSRKCFCPDRTPTYHNPLGCLQYR